MRLTFVGKSGAGKSTVAGLVCRGLAERGERVLAVDADNVPGLALVLGLDVGDEWFLADAAVRKVEGPGWDITMTAAEAVDRYAVDGPLGIRYLQMGKIGTTALNETQLAGFAAFGRMVAEFDEPDGWLVLDTLGGILHAAAGWTAADGPILVVVEPFVKSVVTAARLAGMADEHTAGRLLGVGNKVSTQSQRVWLAGELERIGIPLWAEVPADPAVAEAERNNIPLVNLPAGSPAMTAVTAMVDRLRADLWSVGTSSSKEGT
jgi:CO dehydrogenase maturation factor